MINMNEITDVNRIVIMSLIQKIEHDATMKERFRCTEICEQYHLELEHCVIAFTAKEIRDEIMKNRIGEYQINRTNIQELKDLLEEIVNSQSWDGGNHLTKPATLSHSQAIKARMLIQRLNPPAQTQGMDERLFGAKTVPQIAEAARQSAKNLVEAFKSNRFTFKGKEYEFVENGRVEKDWIYQYKDEPWGLCVNTVSMLVADCSDTKFARPVPAEELRKEQSAFNQATCVVCGKPHQLKELIGTCPMCRSQAYIAITPQSTPSTIDEDAQKQFDKFVDDLYNRTGQMVAHLNSHAIYQEGYRAGRTQGGV